MASTQCNFFVVMIVVTNIWSSDAKPLINQLSLIDSNLTYNNGNYSFRYDNGIGKPIEGTGSLDDLDRRVSGTINYTSPEGQAVSLSWSAGKDGFKANFSIIGEKVEEGSANFRNKETPAGGDGDAAPLGNKAGVYPRGRRAV